MKRNKKYIDYVERAQEINQEREDLKRMEEALPDSKIAEVIDHALSIANECNEQIRVSLEKAGLLDEVTIRVQIPGEEHASAVESTSRKRREKRYINPHTGDVVVTRGGNQKTIQAWKARWGNEEVESWVQK